MNMGNSQKVIALQRDMVFTGYKLLILNDDETGTICTDLTVTPYHTPTHSPWQLKNELQFLLPTGEGM